MPPTGTARKRRFLKEPAPSTSRPASFVKTVVKQEVDYPSESESEFDDFADYLEEEEYDEPFEKKKRRGKIYSSDSDEESSDEDLNPTDSEAEREDFVNIVYQEVDEYVPIDKRRESGKKKIVSSDSNDDDDDDFNPRKSMSEPRKRKSGRPKGNAGEMKGIINPTDSDEGNDDEIFDSRKSKPVPIRKKRGRRLKRRPKEAKPMGKVAVFIAQLPEPHRENLTCPKCPVPKPFKSEFSLYQHFVLGHKEDSNGADSEARKKKRAEGRMAKVADFIAQLPESHRVNLTCPKCPEPKPFKSEFSLYQHFILGHREGRESKAFECEFCERVFSRDSALKYHIQERHSGIRHQCPYCEKWYSKVEILNVHVRTHTGEGLLACTICGKEFPIKNRLVKHMTTHNTFSKESCVQCEICGKEMRDKFRLDQHKARVHSEPEYECEICGKRFVQKFELRRHMDSHKETCDWKCPFCTSSVKTREYLLKHIRRLHDMTSEQAREACDKHNQNQK